MEIIYKSPDELIPYENNAKEHPAEQIELIKNSIREFGFKTPVVVDKNMTIISGHGRVLASKELGMNRIPVIIADDLSAEQAKMLRLADNKVSESQWENDILDFELLEMQDFYNIKDFGFDLDEIEDYQPELLSGDREPIQNMTFTVSDEQHDLIMESLKIAKEYSPNDPAGINQNSNGNALYYICEFFKNGIG